MNDAEANLRGHGYVTENTVDEQGVAGFTTLAALGVPAEDLPELAATAAARAGAQANPRPASAADVLALLTSVF